jgi:hypothetical protein
MDSTTIRLRGRVASTLVGTAVCISATFVAVPFLASTSSRPAQGTIAAGESADRVGPASTLAADRPSLVVLFAIPALLALIAWLGLHRRSGARGRVGAVAVSNAAFALVALTVVFLSSGYLALVLGLVLLPVALLLVAAAALAWSA